MDLDSLLALARGGDKDARERLLLRVRPFLRALFRGWWVAADDASDLTQEVQIRMNRGFEQFRGETGDRFKAWGRRIAARVFYDFLARRRLPTVPLPDDVRDASSSVLSRMARTEDLVCLRDAIEQLPEKYRVVIKGRFFEGLSPQDLADRLGWPRSTVSVFQMRAVEWLAEKLRGNNA
jgi:RNA polymerase sigma-70 factor (ECF subfamily)